VRPSPFGISTRLTACGRDLTSYFDTIPRDRLMAFVRASISDGRVWALVEGFLRQDIVLKLVVGALPVDEVATMRSAFLDPDAMGPLPNAMLIGLGQ
jgi:hypothetical protein